VRLGRSKLDASSLLAMVNVSCSHCLTTGTFCQQQRGYKMDGAMPVGRFWRGKA